MPLYIFRIYSAVVPVRLKPTLLREYLQSNFHEDIGQSGHIHTEYLSEQRCCAHHTAQPQVRTDAPLWNMAFGCTQQNIKISGMSCHVQPYGEKLT